MCCNSVIKKNGVMAFAEKWMELEIIMLSGKPSSDGQMSHVLTHLWNLNSFVDLK
jgi:hypothetical protein